MENTLLDKYLKELKGKYGKDLGSFLITPIQR
jgi:hypothetical protein